MGRLRPSWAIVGRRAANLEFLAGRLPDLLILDHGLRAGRSQRGQLVGNSESLKASGICLAFTSDTPLNVPRAEGMSPSQGPASPRNLNKAEGDQIMSKKSKSAKKTGTEAAAENTEVPRGSRPRSSTGPWRRRPR